MYVAFVDLRKFFDGIYRNGLFYKLYRAGIKGRVLTIIKNMYNSVQSCIKSRDVFSDSFCSPVGVLQGEISSPVLVSMFLEDLETYMHSQGATGIEIDTLSLRSIQFADDMVIFGNSPAELQNNLNIFHCYCYKWV